jgi:hypothetical protein
MERAVTTTNEDSTVARKSRATPEPQGEPTEAQKAAADKVRAERQAKREAKAAAAKAAEEARKAAMGPQRGGRKNPFGIAASAAKATSVTRSIISRARGGRSR